jgi:hypothetical protein
VKAIVQDTYGGPEVLELRDIDQPVASDDEVCNTSDLEIGLGYVKQVEIDARFDLSTSAAA